MGTDLAENRARPDGALKRDLKVMPGVEWLEMLPLSATAQTVTIPAC